MKTLAQMVAVLTLLVPGSALSDTEAEKGGPARPGDEEGAKLASDGLAECAAILVVASKKSRNFISRRKMGSSSRDWFAAAGLLALEEGGEVPDVEFWEDKVTDWSKRIGSVEAMLGHEDWMAYCADMGAKHALDSSHFTVASQ